MSEDKIGVVGQGFVGTALKEGFKNFVQIETFDKYKHSTCESLKELSEKAEIIFVCLPTPMKKTGECDLSIVSETVHQIDSFKNNNIVVIKSTILPGTTEKLNKQCNNIQVIFNPEFLTEANFIEDFKNQNRVIIGGPRPGTTKVKNLYRKCYPTASLIKTGSSTAEMIKYFINCFLATKVSFSNEIKQICAKIDIDYDKVVEYALYDTRLGKSHFSAPGPDGKLGFGGSCFPKDLNAMINFAISLDLEPNVLSAVWNKNIEVRPGRDWESLKGRAVSE